jgi:hypothetical protein
VPFISSVPIFSNRTFGIGRAHHSKLGKVLGIAFGVGAEIQHHHIGIFQGWKQRGERGPVNPGHGAQGQFGHAHQSAGVSRADSSAGMAFLDRIDREAHRACLGLAERLADLVVAGDDIFRMQYFGCGAQIGMVVECGLYFGLVTYQQEIEAVVPVPCQGCACQHDRHAFIAAHRVYGDTRFHRHQQFS